MESRNHLFESFFVLLLTLPPFLRLICIYKHLSENVCLWEPSFKRSIHVWRCIQHTAVLLWNFAGFVRCWSAPYYVFTNILNVTHWSILIIAVKFCQLLLSTSSSVRVCLSVSVLSVHYCIVSCLGAGLKNIMIFSIFSKFYLCITSNAVLTTYISS